MVTNKFLKLLFSKPKWLLDHNNNKTKIKTPPDFIERQYISETEENSPIDGPKATEDSCKMSWSKKNH